MGEIILNLKPRSKVISFKINEYDLAMLDRAIVRVLPGIVRSEILRNIAKAMAYSLSRVKDDEVVNSIVLIVKTNEREIKVIMEVEEHDHLSVNHYRDSDTDNLQD